MNKVYWKTKDGREIDVDTMTDIQHMRNIIKFLLRERDNYDFMDIGDYQDTF